MGQTPIRQIIWPIVYLFFWWWIAVTISRPLRGQPSAALAPRAQYLVIFVAAGYLIWMKLFSVYRYIVPIEMVTPLVVFVLLSHFLPYFTARRAANWTLSIATVVVVAGGAQTWGHQGWSDPLFHADVPELTYPDKTTVLIVENNPAWGWPATFFPANVAFTQLQGSFPKSPAFGKRVSEMVSQRGGPAFAIVNGTYNWRADHIAKINAWLARTGLTQSERGCKAIDWVVSHLRLHATVLQATEKIRGTACELGLRADDEKDVASENRRYLQTANPILERYGFALEPATCSAHRAGIGEGTVVYQWCRVARSKHPSTGP